MVAENPLGALTARPSNEGLHDVALEGANLLAEPVGHRARLALREVDEHERLLRRDHEQVVVVAVRRAFVGDARPSDARNADEDLEQVVEDGRSEILDRRRAHDELAVALTRGEHLEVPVVLDPGLVEVGEVAAVVDDALRVRVGESDSRECRVLERRPAARDLTELERHRASTRARMASTTSSGSSRWTVPARPPRVSAASSALTIASSAA